MKRLAKGKLLTAAVVLFVFQMAMQGGQLIDRWARNYGPAGRGALTGAGLSPDQIIAEMLGFREFLAGILWVKADSFFDAGQYDAVLPIIRLCTILDPHQLDIYTTGMWHIAYNFTDAQERSDRRYIPVALALGQEGCDNNPTHSEVFFEMGWVYFHKIEDDYPQAVKYFEQASSKPDIIEAQRNILAQAYFRNNEVLKALNWYYMLKDKADSVWAKAHNGDVNAEGGSQESHVVEANIDNTIVRMVQRGWIAKNGGWFDKGDYDTKPPFDVGFSARVTIPQAKIIRFQGTWNVLPVGTRIRVVLRDADFPNAKAAELDWMRNKSVDFEPSRSWTFMQDGLFVKNRQFDLTVDMSKDPTMYPLNHDNYIVEFYYNPRNAPPHIQDRFGWSGEGMTDKNFLNTEVRPGQRVMYTSLKLTKQQIRRQGDWAAQDRIPVIQTPNFVEKSIATVDDSVISVPLRAK